MRPARGAESERNEAPPPLSMASRARGAAQGGAMRVLCKLRLGSSLMGTSPRPQAWSNSLGDVLFLSVNEEGTVRAGNEPLATPATPPRHQVVGVP